MTVERLEERIDYALERVSHTDAEVSAHTARLNTINGQLARGADAMERNAAAVAELGRLQAVAVNELARTTAEAAAKLALEVAEDRATNAGEHASTRKELRVLAALCAGAMFVAPYIPGRSSASSSAFSAKALVHAVSTAFRSYG
jgi:hypothetical protein